MKKISNFKGAQELNKNEQKSILGGSSFKVPVGCAKFYLVDADGVNCIKPDGTYGVVTYIGGRDYCC